MAELARPEDVRVNIDADELAASRFLVRYKNPTQDNYRLSLRQWFEFCLNHGVRPLEVERGHVEVWIRALESKGLMASTINGKLNAVVGFYKLAKIDRAIVDDPTEHLRRPSVPRESSRQGLSRGETFTYIEASKHCGPLEHALACFLIYNGPRIGEACRLDCEDLGMQDGYRTVFLSRAKGNRSAPVPLAPLTSHAFDHYLGTRSSGPLFLMQRKPERLDTRAALRIVKRIAKVAGIEKNITPHSLRHTHITLALNAGVGVRDLVNSMGYADSRQIARYDRDKDNLARSATHSVSAFVQGA